MSDSNTSRKNSFLNVFGQMIFSLTGMITFPETDIGIMDHYLFNNRVIFLQTTV